MARPPTIRAALLFLLALSALGPVSGKAVPASTQPDVWPAVAPGDELELTGRVVDAAGILPVPLRQRLTRKLAAYEARTQHQFVVVTTPTLGGTDIALYSVRLFRRWGIGRRDVNDGIGLLVAPNERKVRIEVGYGLERTLPDDEAARIIREIAIPRFQSGELPTGIAATVDAMIASLDKAERTRGREAVAGAPAVRARPGSLMPPPVADSRELE